MSTELFGVLATMIVALIGGSVGWQQIREHGAKAARLDRAEGDIADAEKRAEVAAASPASKSEGSGILRNRLDRAARRLRRTRAGRE